MVIAEYKNGNSNIKLFKDGTRIIEYDDVLNLDYPLNLDIRVSTKCQFGFNPKTGKSFCSFCHESARTDGVDCDYEALKGKLVDLPKGIELAIGCNKMTAGLKDFIVWCDTKGYIVNLTINQGHIKRDFKPLYELIENGLVKGVGISYRSGVKFDVPKEILDYDNTVFHVICGIDTFDEVVALKELGVKKLLVLGEKDFGFNLGNVDLSSRNHREWYWWVHKLFSVFDVVSFDNLALQQLNVKRFFSDENWDVFNQSEHSFYINAVDQTMSPSSRSPEKVDWNAMSVQEYFLTHIN
jgi:hypothetical protein